MDFNECVSGALETRLATTCAHRALEELVGTLRIRQVACSNTLASKHLTIHPHHRTSTCIWPYMLSAGESLRVMKPQARQTINLIYLIPPR